MLILLACGAHGPGLDDRALRDFERLHERVYGVYRLPRDPDAVHGLLSGSFIGEELTRAYVDHWTTLARMEAEETSVAIGDVVYESVEPLGGDRLEAVWRVTATITHRGHDHLRVNSYRAVFELAGGRISGSWVRNAQRLPGEVPVDEAEERVPLSELIEALP